MMDDFSADKRGFRLSAVNCEGGKQATAPATEPRSVANHGSGKRGMECSETDGTSLETSQAETLVSSRATFPNGVCLT